MNACIHRYAGTLDKFIGDRIMAFFGAPQRSDNPCRDGFMTALDMLDALEEFNREQEQHQAPRRAIGIGLHFGAAFIGYAGTKDRHDYSALGDSVNTASRLECLPKEVGFAVVVSATVRDHLSEWSDFVNLGEHALKGRAPMAIFGWKPINLRNTP